METSSEIKEIATALNLMQSELHTVSKDAKGYNYKYADYASIWNVLREPLTKNGLSVIQDAVSSDDGVSVTTRILHESGQWVQFGPLTVPMGKRDAHSTGSGITYARRYGLSAALGIVPDDDDGAAAQKSPPPKAKPTPKVKPMTDDQVDEWIDKWSGYYDLQDLNDYCTVRADHYKHKINVTCAEIEALPEGVFEKNIDGWLKKRDEARSRQAEDDAKSEQE